MFNVISCLEHIRRLWDLLRRQFLGIVPRFQLNYPLLENVILYRINIREASMTCRLSAFNHNIGNATKHMNWRHVIITLSTQFENRIFKRNHMLPVPFVSVLSEHVRFYRKVINEMYGLTGTNLSIWNHSIKTFLKHRQTDRQTYHWKQYSKSLRNIFTDIEVCCSSMSFSCCSIDFMPILHVTLIIYNTIFSRHNCQQKSCIIDWFSTIWVR